VQPVKPAKPVKKTETTPADAPAFVTTLDEAVDQALHPGQGHSKK
jgi:hypothetical protein